MRTSLTLLAAGVALAQIDGGGDSRTLLAVVVVALGVGAAVAGTLRYVAADRALRSSTLPRRGWAPVAIAIAVAVVGLLVLTVVLVDGL